MPRIAPHTFDSAPDSTRPSLEQLRRRMGKLLNIHAGMARSPVVLAAYMGIQQAIAEHGTFDGRTREGIALAVAAVDSCDYCQSAHTAGGATAGLSADEMVAIRRGRTFGDARLEALLDVAREITADVGEVQDATWKQAQVAGWGDEQLAEVFVHVAVNLYTNYWNHYAGTELDVPAAPGVA